MTAPEQQITEHRPAITVNTRYLSIEHSAFDLKIFRERRRKIRKAAEDVSISRNQFSLTGLEMRQRAETVDLQFEDMVIGIEWFRTAGEPHGA